jgi:hypothetical protein
MHRGAMGPLRRDPRLTNIELVGSSSMLAQIENHNTGKSHP